MTASIAGKQVSVSHIPGPLGVRGRNSDNKLIAEKLGWQPTQPLVHGLQKTYEWIELQVQVARQKNRL
jgi:GDP-D-mannose 3',5'-epimerase